MLSDLPSGRFKEYQDLFPPTETCKSNLCLRHEMGNFKTDNLVRRDLLLARCGCCLGKKEEMLWVKQCSEKWGEEGQNWRTAKNIEVKFCSHRLWSPDLDSGK